MARYGQAMKDRALGRLLPPESVDWSTSQLDPRRLRHPQLRPEFSQPGSHHYQKHANGSMSLGDNHLDIHDRQLVIPASSKRNEFQSLPLHIFCQHLIQSGLAHRVGVDRSDQVKGIAGAQASCWHRGSTMRRDGRLLAPEAASASRSRTDARIAAIPLRRPLGRTAWFAA